MLALRSVADAEAAEEYGLVFNAAAHAMADEFWPGPLTLALPGGKGRLPDQLRGAELRRRIGRQAP